MSFEPALDLRYSPSTTSNGLLARFAVPDSDGVALNGVFAAKGTDVASVLGNLHLLHLLSERGTISVGKSVNIEIFIERQSVDEFAVIEKERVVRVKRRT